MSLVPPRRMTPHAYGLLPDLVVHHWFLLSFGGCALFLWPPRQCPAFQGPSWQLLVHLWSSARPVSVWCCLGLPYWFWDHSYCCHGSSWPLRYMPGSVWGPCGAGGSKWGQVHARPTSSLPPPPPPHHIVFPQSLCLCSTFHSLIWGELGSTPWCSRGFWLGSQGSHVAVMPARVLAHWPQKICPCQVGAAQVTELNLSRPDRMLPLHLHVTSPDWASSSEPVPQH